MAILPLLTEVLIISRQIIVLSNLPLSAFGGDKAAELAKGSYVAVVDSDEEGALILGANSENKSVAEINEYYDKHDEAVPPAGLPLGLLSMMSGRPLLKPENLEGSLKAVVREIV